MKLAAGEYKLVINEDGEQFTYNTNGNKIHWKDSDGYEAWYEYDANGNEIHFKDSTGYEVWQEYNAYGNKIHWKNSTGYEEWFDTNGKKITKEQYDALQAPYHDKLVEIEGKQYKLCAI